MIGVGAAVILSRARSKNSVLIAGRQLCLAYPFVLVFQTLLLGTRRDLMGATCDTRTFMSYRLGHHLAMIVLTRVPRLRQHLSMPEAVPRLPGS